MEKGVGIIMYRFDELKRDLSVNHEVEFVYKKFECFIVPTNLGWELWVNNERVYREPVLEVFLMTPCLEGESIFDIFDNALYDEKYLIIL